jgi:dipeptidyl aminopeptidase/acylaminoacyl peptidase
VEGWVLKPSGYDPARSWPLVLMIHGGPHSAFGNDFSFEPQVLAAHGFLVVYTNPRGSSTYGEKFMYATWGGWGKRDYEDLMSGVDYVESHYSVDPKRLGVTGYSYGGFLTNWTISQSTRFAAAVVGGGISNWISDYGAAMMARTKETEFFGPPWDPRAHALLASQSPIEYVAHVTTPTLFLHGESDMTNPIEEDEQMYTSLIKLRVPVRFVRYAGTSHGGWSPWNTVNRYYEELRWFRRFMKSAGGGAAQ